MVLAVGCINTKQESYKLSTRTRKRVEKR